jgi:hypothetical protein
MTQQYALSLTQDQHVRLHAHLFPGDGREAAAILLCRDAKPVRPKLMVVDILLVDHAACPVRTATRLTWPGEALSDAIDQAEDNGLSVILLHSHPGGFLGFSAVDDDSDAESMTAIFAGWAGQSPAAGHGSAVMTPDGRMIARLYDRDGDCRAVERVGVIGDDIVFWFDGAPVQSAPPMAFGSDMTALLGRLHICVVGVSGTGSILAEQAARMGVGRLTLIDFDRIEAKNLNRILNSSKTDADRQTLKVEMFAKAVRRYSPGTVVEIIPATIASREGVFAAAAADVVFSCVDSAEGRQVADVVAQAFMLPLIDMGVTIPTRQLESGGCAIAEVSGRIDYVKPGGSTLGDRGVYTGASLRAEYLARVAPETFEAERAEGYIKGAPQQAPSVIALNMRAASAAMLEFVARLCPFRHEPNETRARTVFALADGDEDLSAESEFRASGLFSIGHGIHDPMLAGVLAQSASGVSQ